LDGPLKVYSFSYITPTKRYHSIMSGIEILSHTRDTEVVSESRIVIPSTNEPSQLQPAIWVVVLRMYTEKFQLSMKGLSNGPYFVNPSFFYPFKVRVFLFM